MRMCESIRPDVLSERTLIISAMGPEGIIAPFAYQETKTDAVTEEIVGCGSIIH